MIACKFAGCPAPITGAPGADAVTAKLCVTEVAALKFAFPAWLATIVQVPADTKVALAPETVHTLWVLDANATVNPVAVVVAFKAIGEALNGCDAMAPKVIVWFALLTVNVNDWLAAGEVVLVAANVRINVPACVGVPVSVAVPELAPPDVNVTPVGSAPPVWVMVGVGTPEALILNVEPAVPTVKLPLPVVGFDAALVKAGATGASDGVNALVTPAALINPLAFVAVTEQVCDVPLTRPVITRGVTSVPAFASVPAFGLHVTV